MRLKFLRMKRFFLVSLETPITKTSFVLENQGSSYQTLGFVECHSCVSDGAYYDFEAQKKSAFLEARNETPFSPRREGSGMRGELESRPQYGRAQQAIMPDRCVL